MAKAEKAEIIKHPVEQISGDVKQSAWVAIIESLATIILGIFLIAFPDAVIKVIAYIVGIFLVIKGAYQIINYFVVKHTAKLIKPIREYFFVASAI